jgi:hypothetical protein
MKKDVLTTFKWVTVQAAVFAPFLVTAYALFVHRNGVAAVQSTDAVDWIWILLLGAMMLGTYYFLAVYLEDEEEITQEFRQLDRDQDGFISREDAQKWPDLMRMFDRFDCDHDGRLSRVDFKAFEHALQA